MYVQRYIPHLPAAGEVVIFDRSWYNRAGVERVMGFCSDDQAKRFLQMAPAVEQAIVDSGILLLKYWLEVGEAEQTKRLQSRVDDPRKIWKLSDMDLESYSRWYDYARARDDMFAATDTAWAPWIVVRTDDKRRGRLNLITHLLGQVPYEPLARKEVTFPKRQPRRLHRAEQHAAPHSNTVLSSRRRERRAPVRPARALKRRRGQGDGVKLDSEHGTGLVCQST